MGIYENIFAKSIIFSPLCAIKNGLIIAFII